MNMFIDQLFNSKPLVQKDISNNSENLWLRNNDVILPRSEFLSLTGISVIENKLSNLDIEDIFTKFSVDFAIAFNFDEANKSTMCKLAIIKNNPLLDNINEDIMINFPKEFNIEFI